jgi:putative redox protein
MSVIIEGRYLGNKRTKLVHGPSGTELTTDAPKDNAGEGAYFSPTDLVAGALGACMMTIIGILAERSAIDLDGTKIRVEKEMHSSPRRIGTLTLELHLPSRLMEPERRKLEAAARTCPVHQSLHPEVTINVQFVYDV